MTICNCYDETEIFYNSFGVGQSKIIQRCLGTTECDECSCGGDRAKCNFYPEVREKAKKEVSTEASEQQILCKQGENKMKDVNSIAICRDNFNTKEEWHDAIKNMVVALLDNNQIMTVRYDEPGLGIAVIEFNPNDQSFGCHYPYWLSPEEEESVVYDR